MNYVRERHGVKSLMARNSTERFGGMYDLESKGSAFSRTSPAGVSTTLTSIYKCSIILVLKGVVFLRGPLYCCIVPDIQFCRFLANCAFVTRMNRVVFERNLHLLRLHYTRLFPDPRFLLFVLQNIAGYKNDIKCG